MACFNTFFIVTATGIFYLVNFGSALNQQAIVGSSIATSEIFPYHVTVKGQKNYTKGYFHLGGGAIVSEKYILSASSVFLESNNDLKPYKFSILLGAQNLSSPFTFRRQISIIMFLRSNSSFLFFDIALAQVAAGIGLNKRRDLRHVRLPDSDDSFANSLGIVTGCGYFEVQSETDPNSGAPIVTKGNYSNIVRYETVTILSDDECAKSYGIYETANRICGVMSSNHPGRIAGICEGDIGNPLVIKGDLLVGIASATTPDCDNTVQGATYLKITSFVHNIQFYLREKSYRSIGFIRYNRVYKPPVE